MSDKRLMSIKFKGIDQTYVIPTVIADDANNDGNVVVKNYPSEAYAQHSVDKANPHSVTAEQVGAAPATEVQGSYTVADAVDLDSTLTSIINSMELSSRRTIHIVYQETTPINKGDWFMTISKTADENYGSVEAIHDYAIGILKKYRSYYSGAWTDWVNIPNHNHAPVDIGAVPISRTINEKALSSNITLNASDVGAAPAGYGLGEAASRLTTDYNTCVLSGYYRGDNAANTPEQTWGIHSYAALVVERGNSQINQRLMGRGCVATRCSLDSGVTWQPWEYEHPPMSPDIEYRTTERIDGKAVYKKKDSSGKMWYRLDGSTVWTEGIPGAAPARTLQWLDTTTAGWYKVGTIKPIAPDFTTACRLSTGGNYSYQNQPASIIDVVSDYDTINAVVTVPATKENVGITKVGFIRSAFKTFDVYVYYKHSTQNCIMFSADMLRGTFERSNFELASVSESDMQVVVTTYQSSFAPSGYGLGAHAIFVNNLDDAKINGWYQFSGSVTIDSATLWHPRIFVIAGDELNLTQELYPISAYGVSTNSKLRRRCHDGAWLPWEWVNPPMQLGVEYRTTERWNGKVVYTKLVNCGALPDNGQKSFAYCDAVNAVAIQMYGAAIKGTESISIPYKLIVIEAYEYELVIRTTENMGNWNGYVVVKYTKD